MWYVRGEKRCAYRVLVGERGGRGLLGDVDVDGRIILRCVFTKWDVWVWTGSSWFRIRTGGSGTCERDNETSGSKKCGEFLD